MARNEFLPRPYAKEILRKYGSRLVVLGDSERSDLLIYDQKRGIFAPGERLLRLQAHNLLGWEVTPPQIDQVFKLVHLRARRKTPAEFDANPNLVVFRNGVLRVNQRKLVEFSPRHLCRTRIPHEYNSEATCPRIDQFLSEVLPQEYHQLVEEILGCVLVGDNRHEKLILMFGPGGNGKSVLLKVATALVGKENAAHVPLQELVDQRFYRAELIGKRLNVYADIEQVSPKQQGILKALVSGDPIIVDRKYRDPVSFSNHAVMVFSCNELPDLGGKTYSIQRRLILIPFRKTFSGEKADKELTDKLTTPMEIPGLINRALIGYKRLLKKGDFSVPAESKLLLTDYLEATDAVAMFIKERVHKVEAARVSKADLYGQYVDYCSGNGYERGMGMRPLSQPRFNNCLCHLLPGLRESKLSGSDRRRAWIGISLQAAVPTISQNKIEVTESVH